MCLWDAESGRAEGESRGPLQLRRVSTRSLGASWGARIVFPPNWDCMHAENSKKREGLFLAPPSENAGAKGRKGRKRKIGKKRGNRPWQKFGLQVLPGWGVFFPCAGRGLSEKNGLRRFGEVVRTISVSLLIDSIRDRPATYPRHGVVKQVPAYVVPSR
jgi:hypothetical protein